MLSNKFIVFMKCGVLHKQFSMSRTCFKQHMELNKNKEKRSNIHEIEGMQIKPDVPVKLNY